MKHILSVFIITSLSIGFGVFVRQSSIADLKLEGTVLQVEEGYALVTKRMNLSEEDLLKSTDEWLFGNYDLIYVGPIYDVEPGMEVKMVIQGPVSPYYSAQAEIESFQIIN